METVPANAVIRGVAKASYHLMPDIEIIGIQDGYRGLIQGEYKTMKKSDFSGILTLGGTILGTSRQPFKLMRVIGEDNVDKVKNMKANYKAMKLDCLLILGGNGTHKTAALFGGRRIECHRPAQDHRQRSVRHRRHLWFPFRIGHRHRLH